MAGLKPEANRPATSPRTSFCGMRTQGFSSEKKSADGYQE
jgi:hypothetical protein